MSADMPPLLGDGPLWKKIFSWGDSVLVLRCSTSELADAIDAEVQAYARAYADAQVRELVEALSRCVSKVSPSAGDGVDFVWLEVRAKHFTAARALIAKHEKQTTDGG